LIKLILLFHTDPSGAHLIARADYLDEKESNNQGGLQNFIDR